MVQNLDRFRKFEAVIGLENDEQIGNQIIIANKNARLLPLWLDTYKVYKSNLWYEQNVTVRQPPTLN